MSVTVEAPEADYCECGEESIVAVGQDHVPLCMTHFRDWLYATFPSKVAQ